MKPIVDMSNNNPEPVNWTKLAKACAGVIHKATEGTGFVDRFYSGRRVLAKAAGIPFGAYHFAHTDADPVGQARFFSQHAGGADRFFLDLETGDPRVAERWSRSFCRAFHELRGAWPVFYSYRAFIGQMRIEGGPIGGGLWLADYGPDDGTPHPVLPPAPWRHVKLHQYTSKGRIDGIAGLVDLSVGTF